MLRKNKRAALNEVDTVFQKYFETFGRYILTNFLTQLEFIAGTIETKKQLNVIEIVL